MCYEWSANARHVQSLFRPWAPGDGFEEAALLVAEGKLGVQLPLSGGAPHGVYSDAWVDVQKLATLVAGLHLLVLPSYPGGFRPDSGYKTWPLYVADGLVVDTFCRLVGIAAARDEDVARLQGRIPIKGSHRW
jgi:hypothetical protein